MHRLLPILIGCVVLGGMFATPNIAYSQCQNLGALDAGTISDTDTCLTYTGGPYTGVNPTNNTTPNNEPDCSFAPNTCDDFVLTIDLPPGYVANHPGYTVTVQVSWPVAANDFDVYIQENTPNGTSKVPPAATSANPEVATIPIEDGTNSCRIRVLVFSAANETFTVNVSLGPPPSGVPGSGEYFVGTEVWSCDQHLSGQQEITDPPTVFDHGQDGEPAMEYDGFGTAWIGAIAGVPAGSGLWRTDDDCAQAYQFLGAPDAGAGGGDTTVDVAPEKNALFDVYSIYQSSLLLAGVTMACSFDGNTFIANPITDVTPVHDREWVAAHGPLTVYMSYREGGGGLPLFVVRSDDGCATWGPASPVYTDPEVDPVFNNKQLGNMVTDVRNHADNALLMAGPNGEGNVYHGFTQNGDQVWVAVSSNFGLTWDSKLVFQGPGSVYSTLFTWLAVDDAGNVYTAFSDGANIYYSVSPDQGNTWSQPIRVNAGSDLPGGLSRTSIFPHIDAGSAGRIVLSWYGHDGNGAGDAGANWNVMHTRCNNALDVLSGGTPQFFETEATNRNFHSGPICMNGTGCSCCRQLLECFEVGIDPQEGVSFITYGSFGGGGSYITRQIKGESARASTTVIDRTFTCPHPGNGCLVTVFGTPCTLPGIEVITDLDAEDAPPVPEPQLNVQSVSIAEPFGDPDGSDVIVFTLKVEDLPADPVDLTPNGMWRILFNFGGLQYLSMLNCAGAGVTFEYGTCELGCTGVGPPLAAEYFPDGTIQFKMSKSDIGNPGVGATIGGVTGESRVWSGDCPNSGAFAPVDVTTSANYGVFGNDYCQPPTVSCPVNFDAASGQHVLDFELTNPSNATASFNVTVEDDEGWVQGGPINTLIADVPGNGGTAPFQATIDIPTECSGITNEVRWIVRREIDSNLVAQCATNVTCTTTGVEGNQIRSFAFDLNGANPVRGRALIRYALPRRVPVRIDVYNVAGKKVDTIVNAEKDTGRYTLSFDPAASGRALSSGVYVLRMQAGSFQKNVRVVMID